MIGVWWGDSLTRPRLDISHHRSARGGEILLLAPGWTSPVVVRRMVGRFSYSPQAGHFWSSFGAWWGDSCTHPRLDISGRRSAHGGEILLLAPGWTSLVVVRRVLGRFSYSPQDGHLWSSFGACWGDSLTRPRLDISGRRSARVGEILLLAPGWTSLVVVRRMVGRFSYSPQAGHLWSSFSAWWGDSLTRPNDSPKWMRIPPQASAGHSNGFHCPESATRTVAGPRAGPFHMHCDLKSEKKKLCR